ncbi:quercetin dioxygenase-like cupin family protein [Bacillus pakistanensis]|uniref:Quercetin dioxygenase-like cupin family protein n=1 Tax=Rossellomorea pakistanensis TaxID=992288 RepID=A0ABS2NID4_9BACI|nr:cupin [Bacillus pakistanensis]MBM7587588.1 quercetin dioxygenase-like cupin family protein [Bacillus pakistanensis]
MRIFTFYQRDGKVINRFESRNVTIHPLVKTKKPFQIGYFYLEAGSVLGMHPATCPQLLMVTGGSGWVRVEGGEKVKVEPGMAVFLEKGEQHESGSVHGMTAIVAEGEEINPDEFLESFSKS